MILNLDFYPFKSRLIFEKTTNQFSTQLTSKLNGTVVKADSSTIACPVKKISITIYGFGNKELVRCNVSVILMAGGGGACTGGFFFFFFPKNSPRLSNSLR